MFVLVACGVPDPDLPLGGSTAADTGTDAEAGPSPSTSAQGDTTAVGDTTGGESGSSSSSTGSSPPATTTDGTSTTTAPPATGSGDTSTGAAGIDFAQIQLELENEGGVFGDYNSCVAGGNCHGNPERNVHIIPNPTPAELMQNWQNIVDVPEGVTPWVTPADDTAQMLNQTPIPDEVRARWLEWIEAGAPFE